MVVWAVDGVSGCVAGGRITGGSHFIQTKKTEQNSLNHKVCKTVERLRCGFQNISDEPQFRTFRVWIKREVKCLDRDKVVARVTDL